MRAAAERLLAPQFRAVVRLIDEPILQPIYDLATPRMAFGRVAIIGDAAFVARPHVGAGVAKAADDAAALVAALADGEVEPALRRFEAVRQPVGMRIIERARHLGAYLQATQTAEERARSQRHSIPEAVHGRDRGDRFSAGRDARSRSNAHPVPMRRLIDRREGGLLPPPLRGRGGEGVTRVPEFAATPSLSLPLKRGRGTLWPSDSVELASRLIELG